MRPGQLCALPPVSPHANLTVMARVGSTACGKAIWQVACACGLNVSALPVPIKKGSTRCPKCNPRGMEQAEAFLAFFPATYAQLQRKFKLTRPQVEGRLRWMRKREMFHVGAWKHAERQGLYAPVFYAGKGEDVPCDLEPRTKTDTSRRYRKRVRSAIKQAEAGGREDSRYVRQIKRHQAVKTIRQARREPQTPFSALFAAAGQGRAHGSHQDR